MMLAQCGAASCDWRATLAHEEAPARGEPGLPLGCAVTYGQRHKGKSADRWKRSSFSALGSQTTLHCSSCKTSIAVG